MRVLRLCICIGAIYLTGCLSYDDLNEMKETKNLHDAKENFEDLVNYLKDPCEDPNLYAHTLETAHLLSQRFDLASHSPLLDNSFYQLLYRNITSIDLNEVDKWETRNLKSEISYLKSFSLQLYLDQKNESLAINHIFEAFEVKTCLSIKQLTLLAKAVDKQNKALKSNRKFCHEYLGYFIESSHTYSVNFYNFLNSQLTYFMGNDSAHLISSFCISAHDRSLFKRSYFEYCFKSTLDFTARFPQENFIHSLSQLHLKNSYEINLRDNLYLKYLSSSQMNTTIRKYPTLSNLNLNYWFWQRMVSTEEIDSIQDLRKNFEAIFKLTLSTNKKLANKAEQLLLIHSPITYAILLSQEKYINSRFQKVLGLSKTVAEQIKFITHSKDYFYSDLKKNFFSPRLIFSSREQINVNLMSYLYRKSEYYCRKGFQNSNIQTFIKILLQQKALGFTVFTGRFSQRELCQLLLSSRRKDTYDQLLPHLWSINSTETVALLLEHTKNSSAERHEYLHLKNLYCKLSDHCKAHFKDEMISNLTVRIKDSNETRSLAAVQDSYELGFKKELYTIISQRWPGYKTK